MTIKLARWLIAIAAVLLAAATGLGAVASHALASVLDPAALHSFETAVDYQFIHSLGLMAIAIYGERHPAAKALNAAAILLLAGIILFCGGVYTSSLDGPGWIAGLAPTGGVSLIVAWLVVGFAALRQLTRK
jgi:uncharacterized membrane protein YgdD (TMEM256/DUF423 family)